MKHLEVLYVDDEEANRVVFELALSERFEMLCVGSGAEALEVLSTHTVAVLVTDQRMPGMSGNQLLAAVRDRHPSVVRVILTAYSSLSPILESVNQGLVARYLVKPWKVDELREVIAWGVTTWQQGQQDGALQERILNVERRAGLGALTAAAFHDLRQPLAALQANSVRLEHFEDLVRRVPSMAANPTDGQRLKEFVEEFVDITRDNQAACGIIRRLADSVVDLVREPNEDDTDVDPGETIRRALALTRHAFASSGVRVCQQGPQRLPHVSISRPALLRVLTNLLVNAAETGETCGHQVEVVVTGQIEEGMLRITVADNGPGIAPEVLPRIFEPLFTTRTEGTGLGLSQCKRIVAEANGELRVHSESGKGTTFSLYLRMIQPLR